MKSTRTSRPRLACEITADQVIVGSAAKSGGVLEACSRRGLQPGTVTPSLVSGNITDATELSRAIADAFSEIGNRGRDAITIIPDSAVRIVLLDFDSLPDKRAEADAVVRFRLKKSLPFDVDQAAISYDVRVANGAIKVLAAVMLRSILDEYEAAMRDAGFAPGVVVPSMFAALGLVEADEPTLVVKVDALTTTLAIVDASQLMLFRTLENPTGVSFDGEQLAADVYPSLVFFEDNYSLQVRKILMAGRATAAEFGPALQAQSGAQVSDLIAPSAVPVTERVPPEQLAGVMGALS